MFSEQTGSSLLSSDGVFAARQLGPQGRLGPDRIKDGGKGWRQEAAWTDIKVAQRIMAYQEQKLGNWSLSRNA